MSRKTRATFRRLAGRRVLVRLPRLFWLYKAFRTLFPRAKPANRAWTFLVKGHAALKRLGLWEAQVADKIALDVRRRELARRDAEWDAAESEARDADGSGGRSGAWCDGALFVMRDGILLEKADAGGARG